MAVTINASTSAGLVQTADTSGVLQLQTNSGTTAVTIDTSQNVGIGTTSPNCRAHFQGGTNSDGSLTFNNQLTSEAAYNTPPSVGTLVSLKYNSSGSYAGMGGWSIGKENATDGNFAGYMAFHTRANGGSTTERMRIDSSGNTILGSNTSTTAYNKLNLWSPASTLNGIFMEKQSQVVVQMGFKANTNTDFFIGTGSYTLGTYGVYLANTGTSWISVSDERQKDIIEPIENALTKVNTLRTVIGKYKHDEEGVRRSFLIAQDVQAVFPEAVKTQNDEEALLGLSYTDVIPLLVAAIKEQQTIINDLKARVTALEAK